MRSQLSMGSREHAPPLATSRHCAAHCSSSLLAAWNGFKGRFRSAVVCETLRLWSWPSERIWNIHKSNQAFTFPPLHKHTHKANEVFVGVQSVQSCRKFTKVIRWLRWQMLNVITRLPREMEGWAEIRTVQPPPPGRHTAAQNNHLPPQCLFIASFLQNTPNLIQNLCHFAPF